MKPTRAVGPSRPFEGGETLFLAALELALAAALLFILTPVLFTLGLLIWLEDGGPPLFGHTRLGYDGQPFRCLKFRSMRVDADRRLAEHLQTDEAARREWSLTQKLRVDPRVTRIGRIIRAYSLDELPQLLNVLRGEMSLVGPRPIVEAEVVRYGRRFIHYCSMRPGITGLWQVSGRSDVSYRRRVAMDVLYARQRRLGLYVWVLFATFPAVARKRGAY